MLPKIKMYKLVEKMLKAKGYKFHRVDGLGWKVFDSGIGYSWLEYQPSAHEDKILLSVDKLRDDAKNFKSLCTDFHNVIVYY